MTLKVRLHVKENSFINLKRLKFLKFYIKFEMLKYPQPTGTENVLTPAKNDMYVYYR